MLKCSAVGLIIAVSLFFFPSFSYEKVVEKDVEETLFIKSLTRPEFKEVVEKGCVSCHEGIEDISPKMTEANVNCVTCHLGNPLGTTAEEAHRGMYANPSDFNIVDKTCGQCHGDKSPFPITPAISNGKRNHVGRMKKSLMATCAGEISGARYLFGEQKSKKSLYGVRAVVDEDGNIPKDKGAVGELKSLPLSNNSHVDNLLRHQCLQCHLYTEGLPIEGRYVAGGCAACHMIYADSGLSESADPTIPKDSPGHPIKHVITNKVPSRQCLHCHNGGPGRMIGMGYIGEVPAEKPSGSKEGDYRYGTPTFQVEPDVHYQAGMECIDCHSSDDLHGDGNIYSKMEDQVAIRCETCHGTPESFASLKDERGELLPHVIKKGGQVILTQKVSEKEIEVPQLARMSKASSLPVAMAILPHTTVMEGKNQLECYSCHVKTVTQCYGCHLKRDDRKLSPSDWVEGISEHNSAKSSPGVWNGGTGYVRWEHPALGLNGKGKVSPYTTGCQVSFTHIDQQGGITSLNRVFKTAGKNQEGLRLPGWSMNPIQPHTITRESRSCESCHNREKSLGWGSFSSPDTLPLERMVDEKGVQAQDVSHAGARPFTHEELEMLGRFTVCLSCHQDMAYPELWKEITNTSGIAKTNKEHEHLINTILINSLKGK